MKVAILQPNYLPWKGVFDMINRVDQFVFLDDVQYTEHDWRNRNKIMTKDGPKWIIVPVQNSGKKTQLISEAIISNKSKWQRKHMNSFQMNYGKAPYYKEYKWIIEDIYEKHNWSRISELDIYSTKLIADVLGIKTTFIKSSNLDIQGVKDDRVISICKTLGATEYISGPAAKGYIVPQKFVDSKIQLTYMEYSYTPYQQLYEPFEHGVTILDMIFNLGPKAKDYIEMM